MDEGLGRGDRLGKFELRDELGAGGMGTVFRAVDIELRREVAVKVLRPEVTGPEARVRITREAQAMAKLAHPNVVRVHELGDDDAGVYLVMELVEGQSLTAWLTAQQRSVAEVLEVFLAAAIGLNAAHEIGLVHRDFKPENVLVDKRGRVRVTDFGLVCVSGEQAMVKREAEIDLLSLALTQTGAVVGTPRYMAPEQFLARPVDARTDQFSFCVALYRALYGEPPFAGTKYGELMDDVIEGRVRAAPSGSDVPPPVRAVLLRGLSAEPAKRFANMKELAEALRVASQGKTKRRNAMIAATAAAWLVGVVGVAAMFGAGVGTSTTTIASAPAPAPCVECATLKAVDGQILSERAMDVVAGPDGQLAWTEKRGELQVIVVDSARARRDLLAAELVPSHAAFAPGGYQVAFASAKKGLFVMESPSGQPERVTDGDDGDPAWLDEKQIVFTRREGGTTHAMATGLSATEAPRRLVEAPRRVLDAMGGRVLLAHADQLFLWKDGREEPLAPVAGWKSARFALDGRGVVVATDKDVWVGGLTVYRSPATLVGAAITTDGRVVVAER